MRLVSRHFQKSSLALLIVWARRFIMDLVDGAATPRRERLRETMIKTVYAAKTNERLAGIASQKLIDACECNPEGKTLASLDKTQQVDDGGVWYPVEASWGHRDAIVVFVEA